MNHAKWLFLAGACCALVSLGAHGESFGPRVYDAHRFVARPMLRATSCPATPQAWLRWRDGAIASLLLPRRKLEDKPGRLIDPDQVSAQSWAIANVFEDCNVPAGIANRLTNLGIFTMTQKKGFDVRHQFGHGPDVDDLGYLAAVKPLVELPCLLKSQEFLSAISNRKTYRKAMDLIDQQNANKKVAGCDADGTQWTTLLYKSRFLGTPGDADAFGRLLIVVRGQDVDQWIQFGIYAPDETGDIPIENVSVVAINKRLDASDRLFSAIIDWWRVTDGSGIVLKPRREVTGITGNCLQCHKTTPLGIHPEKVFKFPDPPDQGTDLIEAPDQVSVPKKLNDLIRRKYVAPRLSLETGDAFAEQANYGPPLGPDSPDRVAKRTPAFMKACTSNAKLRAVGSDRKLALPMTAASIARVKENMTCEQCHNAQQQGVLNFPQATLQTVALKLADGKWPNLIYAYILNGLMPMDLSTDLSDTEKVALFQCLSQEYYDPDKHTGLLVEWLKSGPAPATPAPASSHALLAESKTRNLATTFAAARKAVAGGAATVGKEFDDNCLQCHPKVAGSNGTGPTLFGVVGRQIGTAKDYDYSPSYVEVGKPSPAKPAGAVWTDDDLTQFLADPRAFLNQRVAHPPAATDMVRKYPDAALRRSIVDYLKTLK